MVLTHWVSWLSEANFNAILTEYRIYFDFPRAKWVRCLVIAPGSAPCPTSSALSIASILIFIPFETNFTRSSDELETAYLIEEVSPIGDEEHPHPHRSSRVGQFTADGLFRHPIRAILDKNRKRLSTLLRLSAALLLAIGGYFFWNFFSGTDSHLLPPIVTLIADMVKI